MLLTFILIIISTPSPSLFHSRLKTYLPFLQILPTAAFLFFFRTDSTDSLDCLPILGISVFLLFSFSVFTLF